MISSSGRQIQEKTDKKIIWMGQKQFQFCFGLVFLLNGTLKSMDDFSSLADEEGLWFRVLILFCQWGMPSTVITFKAYCSSLICYWGAWNSGVIRFCIIFSLPLCAQVVPCWGQLWRGSMEKISWGWVMQVFFEAYVLEHLSVADNLRVCRQPEFPFLWLL